MHLPGGPPLFTLITPLILEHDEVNDTWTVTGVGTTRNIDLGAAENGVQEFDFALVSGSDDTTGKFFGWWTQGGGINDPRSTVDFDEGGTTLELDVDGDPDTGDVGNGSVFNGSTTISRTYSMQVSFNVTESADAVRAQFIDMTNLDVFTAGGQDLLNVNSAPGEDVTNFSLGSGDAKDIVQVFGVTTTNTVDLGAGDDEVTIATTGDSTAALTVNGDLGEDFFSLVTVGTNTTTFLNGENPTLDANDEGDNDLFVINGDQLTSTSVSTINGGHPSNVAMGDKLVFNPGDPNATVNPTSSGPAGNLGIDGTTLVSFSDIEDVVIESGPLIIVPNANPSINEGDDLSISVSLPTTAPQNAGVTEVTWTIAGKVVDNGGSTTLDLAWDELDDFEIDNGFEIHPILVSATRTTTDGDITTTEIIMLEVFDTPPTINLTGDSAVPVGDEYSIIFTATDPGNDALDTWIIDWGDGQSNTYGSGVNTAGHNYETPGEYTVTVSVIDVESKPLIASTATLNVDATVAGNQLTAGVYSIKEGEALQLTGEVVGSPVSVSWDINSDGTFGDATSLNALLDWNNDLTALGIDGGFGTHQSTSRSKQRTSSRLPTARRNSFPLTEPGSWKSSTSHPPPRWRPTCQVQASTRE